MHTLDEIYNIVLDTNTKVTPAPCTGLPVAKTGQTPSYATGDDGDLEKGIAWPNPRFTDNGDGTVTDNLTGLIWLKNADCFGQRTWATALSDSNGLASGSCGLSDGSAEGAWRLPNVKELQSLIHYGVFGPAVPNTAGTGKWTAGNPFTSVVSSEYWSGTSDTSNTTKAWKVHMYGATIYTATKAEPHYVWPVRSDN